jgi:ectoine hydroxylase-related dioxygenase (phytanoyl-CoA dioxygenase family)
VPDAIARISAGDPRRLSAVLEALRSDGCAILENVLDAATLSRVRRGLYKGLALVRARVGEAALERTGEIGVVRAPMLASDAFFGLLEAPELLEVVDAALSPTAILHLQNGFVLPPAVAGDESRFQRRFHRDFPRVLNGFVCSINTLIAVDDFTVENGATVVIPGSHQSHEPPDTAAAIPAECSAGSVLVFDSTLWHAAGRNATAEDRCAVNHQFTQSFFKQQLDYVRCLGEERIRRLSPRTQQLLGWYTRVPESLEQYYSAERVYRAGQG